MHAVSAKVTNFAYIILSQMCHSEENWFRWLGELRRCMKRVFVKRQLECGPMPNVMVALPNIDGAVCSTPQTLADAHY